jgi:DNA-binding beta-propeller fold protein YncE
MLLPRLLRLRSLCVAAVSLCFAAPPCNADLFVSSFTQNSVRRYDASSGAFLGTFITAGLGGVSAPHRARFGPDGNFYVASANNDRILRYNGVTGAFLDVFATAPQLDYPVDFEWGPDGNLYVSSQLNDSIVRFNGVTGAFIDVFVTAGSGGLDGPSGMQFHGTDLFTAGRFNAPGQNHVYRYDALTGAFELAFGASEINTGFGLDFGADGNLYVVSGGSNVVVKFDPATGTSMGNFVTSGSGGLNGAIGAEFGPDGHLYVASLNTDIIERFNGLTGAALGDFVTAGSGGLDAPNFLTFAIPEPRAPELLAGTIGIAMLWIRRAPRPLR